MSSTKEFYMKGQRTVHGRQSNLLKKIEKEIEGASGVVVLIGKQESTLRTVSYFMLGSVSELAFYDLQKAIPEIVSSLENGTLRRQ